MRTAPLRLLSPQPRKNGRTLRVAVDSLHLGFFSGTEVLRSCFKAVHNVLTAPPAGQKDVSRTWAFFSRCPNPPSPPWPGLWLHWGCVAHTEASMDCDRRGLPLGSAHPNCPSSALRLWAAPGPGMGSCLQRMSNSLLSTFQVSGFLLECLWDRELLLLVLPRTQRVAKSQILHRALVL